jgi:diguanylate cyclase (GGDEF)-like protein
MVMGRSGSRRGQLLYPLVYVASLTLVAFSSAALALLGHDHVVDAAVQVAVVDDQATVRGFVTSTFTASELEGGELTSDRHAELGQALAGLARDHAYRDVVVLSPRFGVVLASPAGEAPATLTSGTNEALASGRADAHINEADGTSSSSPSLVESLPLVQGTEVRLVVQIRRDAAPILTRAGEAWRDVVIVTVGAAIVLAMLLYAIFQAANIRLRRQDEQLLESRRRDPLTGLLNHGTAVAALTELVEQARGDSTSFGIALADLDNFRLLNDVHGSLVGDTALMTVADAFDPEAEHWTLLGRFGPDEFVAIAPTAVARDLPAAMQRVRERLATRYLGSESERLPISISVGIAYFPFHADGVTELLSVATTALAEAKAGGGDEVAIAHAWTDEARTAQTTFDVLQGLVLAVDRKDRYTRHHSEDVAAYALFLADRMGLPDEMQAGLRIAGLLHDVGKIGVPDDILRKPGRLSPHEYEIVKQHVALGDLIVRDVPDIELVRAGVRYHHERWDGGGYMIGLAGEDIPLIARILAVVDAFSAMTTTRPYRTALPVERALAELRAAAGTQLDADLVETFVTGMELDPDAPRPGAMRDPKLLWTTTRAA